MAILPSCWERRVETSKMVLKATTKNKKTGRHVQLRNLQVLALIHGPALQCWKHGSLSFPWTSSGEGTGQLQQEKAGAGATKRPGQRLALGADHFVEAMAACDPGLPRREGAAGTRYERCWRIVLDTGGFHGIVLEVI